MIAFSDISEQEYSASCHVTKQTGSCHLPMLELEALISAPAVVGRQLSTQGGSDMVMSELWWMGGIWFQSRQQTLYLLRHLCVRCPLLFAVRIGSELRATFARFEAADGSLSNLPPVFAGQILLCMHMARAIFGKFDLDRQTLANARYQSFGDMRNRVAHDPGRVTLELLHRALDSVETACFQMIYGMQPTVARSKPLKASSMSTMIFPQSYLFARPVDEAAAWRPLCALFSLWLLGGGYVPPAAPRINGKGARPSFIRRPGLRWTSCCGPVPRVSLWSWPDFSGEITYGRKNVKLRVMTSNDLLI